MTVKKFIEKAVEGGYQAWPEALPTTFWLKGDEARMFLDPEAWEAVGKVEGWEPILSVSGKKVRQEKWLFNMHSMIDALVNGKTIEEYLATLT